MLDREEVISKVQKMQALIDHEGTNEHERTTAFNMLQKMMLKYSIEQAELGVKSDDGVVIVKVACHRMKQWQRGLGSNIAFGMKCQIITSKTSNTSTDLVFIGHKVDVEVAVYLFETLARTLSRAGRKQFNDDKVWKEHSEGKYLNGYINAAANEINRRLLESYRKAVDEAQCTDLVVVRGKEVEDHMNEAFPNLRSGRRAKVTPLGSREGREKGQSVELQRGISGSKTEAIR